MPYTGTFLFAFIIWHLFDFTFSDHEGPRSVMPTGVGLGLYGVVYNAFSNPWHSLFYIAAMGCLGFHLGHGIQSFFQTFGVNDSRWTPRIQKLSNLLGLLVAFGFSSIPVFVMLHHAKYMVGL